MSRPMKFTHMHLADNIQARGKVEAKGASRVEDYDFRDLRAVEEGQIEMFNGHAAIPEVAID